VKNATKTLEHEFEFRFNQINHDEFFRMTTGLCNSGL
jgi:hypothetical protein